MDFRRRDPATGELPRRRARHRVPTRNPPVCRRGLAQVGRLRRPPPASRPSSERRRPGCTSRPLATSSASCRGPSDRTAICAPVNGEQNRRVVAGQQDATGGRRELREPSQPVSSDGPTQLGANSTGVPGGHAGAIPSQVSAAVGRSSTASRQGALPRLGDGGQPPPGCPVGRAGDRGRPSRLSSNSTLRGGAHQPSAHPTTWWSSTRLPDGSARNAWRLDPTGVGSLTSTARSRSSATVPSRSSTSKAKC